jgi:hypothetical protein
MHIHEVDPVGRMNDSQVHDVDLEHGIVGP